MKIFLKYLFVVLGIFLSNQINACDFGKKSEVQSSSNLYCGFPVLDIRIKNKSDVLTVIGEVRALRAERLLAIAQEEAFYTDDIAQVYTKLKGKNIDEAIDVLDDLNKLANGVVKNVDDYKLFWRTLFDIPKTSQKEYILWRRVDKSWEPVVTHPMQTNYNLE